MSQNTTRTRYIAKEAPRRVLGAGVVEGILWGETYSFGKHLPPLLALVTNSLKQEAGGMGRSNAARLVKLSFLGYVKVEERTIQTTRRSPGPEKSCCLSNFQHFPAYGTLVYVGTRGSL